MATDPTKDTSSSAEPNSLSPHPTLPVVWESHSPVETEALGEWIGRLCRGSDTIALVGELGAGKTCMMRGMAKGLGIPPRYVASPTFALIHEYEGRVPVVHMDLYRLDPLEALHGLGLEEYLESAAVTVIEWADKAPSLLPRDHLRIELHHLTNEQRRIRLIPHGARYESLIQELINQCPLSLHTEDA